MPRSPTQESERIAAEILFASADRRQVAPFTGRLPGLDLDAAHAVTAALRRARWHLGKPGRPD